MGERFESNGGRNNRVRQSEIGNHDEALDPIYGREMPFPKDAKQQSVVPLLSSRDFEYLANHLSQVVTQALSKQVQVQAPLTRKGNSDFENKVISFLENIFNGITAKDASTGQKYYSISKLLRDQERNTGKLDSIINEVLSLRRMVEDQTKVIDKQATIIQKQHERIIQYENDVIYKTQKDLIMELIGIADQLRFTLNDYAAEKDFDSLYKSIIDLTKWVNGSLQAVGVRKSVNIDNEFDRKKQEIVEIQETEVPEKDGKIESILPGYIWAVPLVGSNEVQDEESPKTYEFVIRPEQVARLRYVKPIDESVQQGQKKQTNAIPKEDDENREIETLVVETGNIQRTEVKDVIESADERKEEKKTSFWERWID